MEFSEFKSTACAALRALRSTDEARPLNLVVLEVIPSTNDLGRRFVADMVRDSVDVPDTLLLAHEQTRGRGRRGNSWKSSAGLGVYASLVVGVKTLQSLRALPMVVGVALAKTLDPYCGGDPQRRQVKLKWPNDLLVGGCKLGGILIESVQEGDERGVVIGFGINHGYLVDQMPHENATSVAVEWNKSGEAGARDPELPDVASLAIELAQAVRTGLLEFRDAESIVGLYREWSAHVPGDKIAFALGNERLEGVLLEIDDLGCLLIDLGSEVRTVAAGEVIQGAGAR